MKFNTGSYEFFRSRYSQLFSHFLILSFSFPTNSHLNYPFCPCPFIQVHQVAFELGSDRAVGTQHQTKRSSTSASTRSSPSTSPPPSSTAATLQPLHLATPRP